MTTAAAPSHGLQGLLHNKKAMIGALALAVLGFLYLRSRSSSSTTSTAPDPNAVDPATGLTYAQEEQAAATADASGTTLGDSGTVGATPSTDTITTPDGTTLSAALEGLTAGLTASQTQQANDEALLQSTAEAAATLQQEFTQLSSLAAPGPTTVVNYEAPVNNDNAGGDTVYQAPVTQNYAAPDPAPAAAPAPAPKAAPAPAPTPAPAPATPKAASPVPKATVPNPTVKANPTGASANKNQGIYSIH